MTARKESPVQDIKRAQRESQILRQVSQLFVQAGLDDPRLHDFFISRVRLSSDKGICYLYFYTARGEQYFKDMLGILKLYKPSMRKALAETLDARYTPDLVFIFDEQFEKQQKIESLLEKLKVDEQL
jgi:ribosome-binding factor A